MTRRERIVSAALDASAALAVVAALFTLAACGDDEPSPTGDVSADDHAIVIEPTPRNPWIVIQNLDRFPNVASMCSPFQDGWRIYVITQTENAKAAPVLTPDPNCLKTGLRA